MNGYRWLAAGLGIIFVIHITTILSMRSLWIKRTLLPSCVKPKSENVCGSRDYSLPLCPQLPTKSDRSVQLQREVLTYDELLKLYGKNLTEGGHFRPRSCRSDQKVAIVIPYRNRDTNLKQLLNNLIPFLKRQNVEYHFFVAEQLPGSTFNRGMILNIGFTEARKICDFDCVFLHDIDMTPVDNGNIYKCGDQPRHHSRNLKRWNSRDPGGMNFGGVVSMKTEQFLKVNGYPNSYFAYGYEDHELGQRVLYHGMNRTHYPFPVCRYEEFDHKAYRNNKLSGQHFPKWKKRVNTDGLNSLYYTLKGVIHKPLFTHIFVEINITTVRNAYNGDIVEFRKQNTSHG